MRSARAPLTGLISAPSAVLSVMSLCSFLAVDLKSSAPFYVAGSTVIKSARPAPQKH